MVTMRSMIVIFMLRLKGVGLMITFVKVPCMQDLWVLSAHLMTSVGAKYHHCPNFAIAGTLYILWNFDYLMDIKIIKALISRDSTNISQLRSE